MQYLKSRNNHNLPAEMVEIRYLCDVAVCILTLVFHGYCTPPGPYRMCLLYHCRSSVMMVWSVWLFRFISRSSWSPRGCNSGGNYRHHSNTLLESWGRQSQPYLPLQPASTQSIFSWLADRKNRWEKLSNSTSRLFKTPAHHNNHHWQLQEQILLKEQW